MIRHESYLDFLTWGTVGAIAIFLCYVYATSSEIRSPVEDAPDLFYDGYFIARVIDGDSLIAEKNGERIEVRIAGIDSPEFGQPFADKAKEAAEKLCLHQLATLKRFDTDRYGRFVCSVVVDDVDIAEELVSLGFAWHFKKYSGSARLDEREQTAREQRKGLWSAPRPIPPWEWRAKKDTTPRL